MPEQNESKIFVKKKKMIPNEINFTFQAQWAVGGDQIQFSQFNLDGRWGKISSISPPNKPRRLIFVFFW